MGVEDIWSSIDGSSQEPTDWLIRQGNLTLGPIPTNVVLDKLMKGEISTNSQAAPEGSGDFLFFRQIEAFRVHLPKAIKAQSAKRRKKQIVISLMIIFIGLPAIAAGVYWAHTQRYIRLPFLEKNIAAMRVGKRMKSLDANAVPDLKLVGLVDLDKAEKGLKIRGAKKKTPRKGKIGKKGGSADAMEGPVGCMLEQSVIFGVVKRSLPKWRTCIQGLASSEPDALPDVLHLGFTVTKTGSLNNFKVLNRHLRKGPFRNCMLRTFSALRFPASKGSNCTVDDWPIPLKR